MRETKRAEHRSRTSCRRRRLEGRHYDVIEFRNGYATQAPEMQVKFLGVRRIKKWGKPVYAIRLGQIMSLRHWRGRIGR